MKYILVRLSKLKIFYTLTLISIISSVFQTCNLVNGVDSVPLKLENQSIEVQKKINFFLLVLMPVKAFILSHEYIATCTYMYKYNKRAASVTYYESYRRRSVTTQTLMSSYAHTKTFTTMNVDCHFQDHASLR